MARKPNGIDVDALIEKAKNQERASTVWKPTKPGEALVGELCRMKWVDGDGVNKKTGEVSQYLMITVRRTQDNELVRHACGVILQEEIENQQVQKGEIIAIYYHGKEGRTGIYSLATMRE